MRQIQALLFDLDGTLMDTAPDLTLAMNILLKKYNKGPVDAKQFRNYIHGGSTSMLIFAFGIQKEDPQYNNIRSDFLQIYYENLFVHTRLFVGMHQVLQYLDQHYIPWGIVTNKPGWLAETLLKRFNLFSRAACFIAGDTLTSRKPDPGPLLKACEILNVAPEHTAYVGDTESDAMAAHAAQMLSISMSYGYAPEDKLAGSWPTDFLLDSAEEIIPLLKFE